MRATSLSSPDRKGSVLPHFCFALLALALICAPPALGQLTTDPTLERGMKPYGMFEGGAIDSVSTTNGSLNLHIPLVCYPQRGGKLQLCFDVKYDNNSYAYSTSTLASCGQPPYVCSYGTQITGPVGVSIVSNLGLIAYVSGSNPPASGPYSIIKTPDGSQHEMGAVSGGWRTIDASGYLYLNNSAILIDRNGIRYTSFNSSAMPQRIEDPNGNYITGTSNSSGQISSYTDTMSRTIPVIPPATSDFSGCTGTLPTASAQLWNLPGYQGGQMTYKLCYANIYYGERTCLKDNGTTTCGVTLQQSAVIQSIVLPNNTAWTFQYDSANPNVSGSAATGNLLQITFPTGGYIKYGWGAVYMCQTPLNTTVTTYTYAVGSRTVNSNDGTGEHTTSYSFVNVGLSAPPFSTSSLNPLGEKTVHTISAVGGTCGFYETQTQTFDSTGTLEKTVSTDYTGNVDPYYSASSTRSCNVVSIRTTTTWPNGQTSKVETNYDSGTPLTGTSLNALYGVSIAKREYDYGSGLSCPLAPRTGSYDTQSS